MKIAYLIRHDITKNDGVTKKILGHISNWKRMGCDVQVFAYVPQVGKSILPANQYVMYGAIKSRLVKDYSLLVDIENFSPDLIYFRYDTWSRSLGKLLNKYPSVVELNTLDLAEYFSLMKFEKNIKSFLRYVAYKILRGFVLRKVVGIVSVTHEINDDESNSQYNKPSVVVPNGIDLDTYKTMKPAAILGARTSLFFIGTPGQPWHGVDLIEQLAVKMPNIDFHIVGIEGAGLSNVFYHGYLPIEKYTILLKQCAICIGTLGLHRKNMTEACPLKVREYLAYGYPVILGYQDTAFIDQHIKPKFVHTINLAADLPDNIVTAIQHFIDENKDIVISHEEIHFLDTKFLEQKRIAFFELILARHK